MCSGSAGVFLLRSVSFTGRASRRQERLKTSAYSTRVRTEDGAVSDLELVETALPLPTGMLVFDLTSFLMKIAKI